MLNTFTQVGIKVYCVFGNPIIHSKSPLLHNHVFYKLGLPCRYTRYKLETSQNFRELFFNLGLSGANITVPYKESLIEFCDEIRSDAMAIGAINTIVREGKYLIGYNTDAIGFYENLKNHNIKSTLVIGAGGSAKAVAHVLMTNGIQVVVVNRSLDKLESFRDKFICYLASDEIYLKEQFDLIVNCTSSSLKQELPLKKRFLESLFSNAKIAYDLMYGVESEFLKLSRKNKIQCIDGKDMLLYQAVEANYLFLQALQNTESKVVQKSNKSHLHNFEFKRNDIKSAMKEVESWI